MADDRYQEETPESEEDGDVEAHSKGGMKPPIPPGPFRSEDDVEAHGKGSVKPPIPPGPFKTEE